MVRCMWTLLMMVLAWTVASSRAMAQEKPPGGVTGIDVSHHQGEVDWRKVRADGVAFAFAKASQGTSSGDPAFTRNWEGMKAAGVIRGAYAFYVAGASPEEQAQDFIRRVQLESGDLPPVVDIETMGGVPEAQQQLMTDLQAYLSALIDHYGVRPIIYTGPAFWESYGNENFSDHPLWIAEYASRPRIPTGWQSWTFWQHSDSGSIDGVTGAVDLSHFNGNIATLQTLLLK